MGDKEWLRQEKPPGIKMPKKSRKEPGLWEGEMVGCRAGARARLSRHRLPVFSTTRPHSPHQRRRFGTPPLL